MQERNFLFGDHKALLYEIATKDSGKAMRLILLSPTRGAELISFYENVTTLPLYGDNKESFDRRLLFKPFSTTAKV